ncbi:hypothetical protein [Chryseolinea sp. H1M3-3]|uniref:hypothetical protein n=1 Tax=Chryseolinea sp. H1M3-3 TaxID=3034144 RepID=UPI0023EB4575|nr:hypothetical protein [Chryseolinea sp. H1M3-3]
MIKNSLTLLFVLSIIFSTSCLAQDFLVTVQGDTLRGDVKALDFGVDKKVQITETGKKKTVYPFFKVKGFSINNEVYQPVKGPNGYAFMKVVKTGYLSLYAFKAQNQTTYGGLYLLKKDGEGIEVPNLTFKKNMRKFLDDCPVVADKIDRDLLNKKDIHKIVDEYNACVENRTSAAQSVVATATPKVKVSDAWDVLENKVKAHEDFEGKANALEMISEIKSKISSSQKIPNFLIEGLKSSLAQEEFKAELENALKEIQ